MPITINGSTGIAGVDGSASTPAIQGTDTNTGITFPAADTVAVSTGGSERMRVDSSGNVGIGTNAPSVRLDVSGQMKINDSVTMRNGSNAYNMLICSANTAYSGFYATYNSSNTRIGYMGYWDGSDYIISTDGATPLILGTNGSSRGGFTAGGEFYVGPNGPGGAKYYDIGSNGGYTYRPATTGGIDHWYSNNGGTQTLKSYIAADDGRLIQTSDTNLKKDIEPARNYLDDLMKIEVVKYHWKTDDESRPKLLGVIAQQVETVFPGLVKTYKYEDGRVQKMVASDVFVSMLITAVQELKRDLDTANVRIAALEAK